MVLRVLVDLLEDGGFGFVVCTREIRVLFVRVSRTGGSNVVS